MENFGPTYKPLAADKPMAASDRLNKLSTIMDNQDLMRLFGRLRHAGASYGVKHLSLIYAKHPIVRKLIEDDHERNYHEGTEYVRSILQKYYWIFGLQNAFRNVKLKCGKCRKQQVGGVQPFMADLPRERFEERVFPLPTLEQLTSTIQSVIDEEMNHTLVLCIHMFDNNSCA